ncbi:hypothetical protein I350_07871 [Cryptococcus amylolentus CBS 6273]|nr:hypothetical protein I350_07871 [Cryptococcus amylolentus CBS 6273]
MGLRMGGFEALRSQISDDYETRPWELFIFASQVDDRVLGRHVLESMDDGTFFQRGCVEKINRLQHTWALAVYQALLYNKDPNLELKVECDKTHISGRRWDERERVDVDAGGYINLADWKDNLKGRLFGDV